MCSVPPLKLAQQTGIEGVTSILSPDIRGENHEETKLSSPVTNIQRKRYGKANVLV